MRAIDPSADKPRCFVISPIGEKGSDVRAQADKVLRHIIREALEPEYAVSRADDESNPGAITPQIIASIMSADLIVADISGGNANVFYELAIAHGYDRPTVHMQNTGHRPPFDIKDMRVIDYDVTDLDSVADAKRQLKNSAKYAAENPESIDTPLKGAESFRVVQSSEDPSTQVQSQILEELAALRADISSQATGPGSHTDADNRSLRLILSRAGNDNRLKEDDFRGVVTSDTSSVFDEWAKKAVKALTKVNVDHYVYSIVWDDHMKADRPGEWEDVPF